MPDDALQRFQKAAAGPLKHVRDEPRLGWVTGRHLLETEIDENTAYAGGYLHLSLRQAERKIPSSLLKAECRMAELKIMAEEGKEVLSRKRKKDIKVDVTERLLPDMPPQIKGIPFVVDENSEKIYVGATSDKQMDTFIDYFTQCMGFSPVPLVPDELATEMVGDSAAELPKLIFAEQNNADDPSPALGKTFLTWLWYYLDQRKGQLPETQLGELYMVLDGPLVFVADSEDAQEVTMRKGAPTFSAEARAALQSGKKLKRAKITLARVGDEVWEGSLDVDNMSFRSFKLPDSENLDSESMFEDRLNRIHELYTVITELYKLFLTQISDSSKASQIQAEIKEWGDKLGQG